MAFIVDFSVLQNALELIFILIALFCINFFVLYYVKRKFVIYTMLITSLATSLSYVFQLRFFVFICVAILVIVAIISISVNIAETRTLLDNKFPSLIKLSGKKKKTRKGTAVYSHEDFYHVIERATLYLSDNKIGALMTFEKNDNFEDICKNGTILNAPVTYELLITIFYPGTRLHDGAVVIRDNMIMAASVFYTPSTEMIGVKRGSRHRAALGISSETDAVTVVVSEETGKISIAMDGELTSYTQEEFYSAFANIMERDVKEGGKVGE